MTTYIDINIILDRSGSMHLIKHETIEGFNTFLQSHKSADINAKITLVQFDHEYEVVYEEKKIKRKRYLDNNTYVPRGMTALYDPIGKTIHKIDKRHSKKKNRPEVLVAIITDGYENNSQDYSLSTIKKMILDKTKKRNWTFVYLGAEQDAIFEGTQMGIKATQAHGFRRSRSGVDSAFSIILKKSLDISERLK